MTPSEIAFLLTRKNVLADLIRYNRAYAWQSADDTTRRKALERVRELEQMERNKQ